MWYKALDGRWQATYNGTMSNTQTLKEVGAKTILELFEGHPERFCQGYEWLDKDGDYNCNEDTAAKCCLVGASVIVYGYTSPQLNKLREAIYPNDVWGSIVAFNDSHSFNDIVEMVRKAGV